MPFKHFPLLKHPELISSYCSLCGDLVAASPNPEILKILERLHDCPLDEAFCLCGCITDALRYVECWGGGRSVAVLE